MGPYDIPYWTESEEEEYRQLCEDSSWCDVDKSWLDEAELSKLAATTSGNWKDNKTADNSSCLQSFAQRESVIPKTSPPSVKTLIERFNLLRPLHAGSILVASEVQPDPEPVVSPTVRALGSIHTSTRTQSLIDDDQSLNNVSDKASSRTSYTSVDISHTVTIPDLERGRPLPTGQDADNYLDQQLQAHTKRASSPSTIDSAARLYGNTVLHGQAIAHMGDRYEHHHYCSSTHDSIQPQQSGCISVALGAGAASIAGATIAVAAIETDRITSHKVDTNPLREQAAKCLDNNTGQTSAVAALSNALAGGLSAVPHTGSLTTLSSLPSWLLGLGGITGLMKIAARSGSRRSSKSPSALDTDSNTISDLSLPEDRSVEVLEEVVEKSSSELAAIENVGKQLEAGIPANEVFIGDDSAMHHAMEEGFKSIIPLLISAGFSVDQQDKAGQTPLMIAAGAGNLSIVTFLLRHGARIDHQDVSGYCALHMAVANEQTLVVRTLLEAGANVDVKAFDNESPLTVAAKAGSDAMIQLLLTAGSHEVPAARQAIAEQCIQHADEFLSCMRSGDNKTVTDRDRALRTVFSQGYRASLAYLAGNLSKHVPFDYIDEASLLTAELFAEFHKSEGLLETAEYMYSKILLSLDELRGKNHKWTLETTLRLGRICLSLNNPEKAERCFARALAKDKRDHTTRQPFQCEVLVYSAVCAKQLGRTDEAINKLGEAFLLAEKVFKPQHSLVGKIRKGLRPGGLDLLDDELDVSSAFSFMSTSSTNSVLGRCPASSSLLYPGTNPVHLSRAMAEI